MSDAFWENIERQLDMIEEVKPNTASHVVDILKEFQEIDNFFVDGDGFFEGSGGDRQLIESLWIAGWKTTWMEADYYWIAQHPATGEQLKYIEGDVYILEPANNDRI